MSLIRELLDLFMTLLSGRMPDSHHERDDHHHDHHLSPAELKEHRRTEYLDHLQHVKEARQKKQEKHCGLCNKTISRLEQYTCPYCKKKFCRRHQIPEMHRCKMLKMLKAIKDRYGVKKAVKV